MSTRSRVTVTVEVELPDRPASAQVTFGEAQRAITDVARSREFTIALLVALSGGVDGDPVYHLQERRKPTGALAHRAAEVTANLSTEHV